MCCVRCDEKRGRGAGTRRGRRRDEDDDEARTRWDVGTWGHGDAQINMISRLLGPCIPISLSEAGGGALRRYNTIRHYKSTCDKRQNMALALEAGQVYCFSSSSSSSFFLSVYSTRIQTYTDSPFIELPHRTSHTTTLQLYFHQTGTTLTLSHSHTPLPLKLPTTVSTPVSIPTTISTPPLFCPSPSSPPPPPILLYRTSRTATNCQHWNARLPTVF